MPATPRTNWLILRAVHPASSSTQLPSEVASLLGIEPHWLATLDKPSRVISFLSRGPGVLRVIANVTAGDLYISELAQHRVIGMAATNPQLVINLPDAVERYLKLTTYQLDRPGLTGTDDSIAWLAPVEEVRALRRAIRNGQKPPLTGAGAHAYLIKAESDGLLPPLESLERGLEKRSASTHGLKIA